MPKFTAFISGRSAVTIADADEIPIIDVTATSVTKKITWANLKTAIGTVFAPINDATFTGNTVAEDATADGEVLVHSQAAMGPIDASTGTFSGAVIVPAATAATHAAQVSAITAATGQLQVGGVEMGDTGWRDVSSLLANGWTATRLHVRRIGYVVYWRVAALDSTSATNPIFVAGTSIPDNWSPDATHVFLYTAASTSSAAPTVLQGYLNTSGALIAANTSADLNMATSYATTTAWPTSLLGSAV